MTLELHLEGYDEELKGEYFRSLTGALEQHFPGISSLDHSNKREVKKYISRI